jgi:Ca2+-binding RTX toxin-like protein
MASITEAEGFASGIVQSALGHMIAGSMTDDPPFERRIVETTSKGVREVFTQFDIPLGQVPGEAPDSFEVWYQPMPESDFDPAASGEYPGGLIGSFQMFTSAGRLLVAVDGLSVGFADLFGPGATVSARDLLLGGPTRYLGNSGAGEQDGGGGNDTLSGRGGDDTLSGGAGADDLNGDAGRDVLAGGGRDDRLFGGDDGDDLSGGRGDDLLAGGEGNDTLAGGGGDDRLIGGFGRDTLTGGAGADSFVYQTLPALNDQESGPGRRDTITDFDVNSDVIDAGFILAQTFVFLGQDGTLTGAGQITYRHAGADTIVDISTDADAGADLSIRLAGLHDLTEANFVL